MREETGDLWTYPADAIVIPTNWRVKANGWAVMGAGVALTAAERWPWLPAFLGQEIRASRLPYVAVFRGGPSLHIACFPTKQDWRNPSDLPLIAEMARQLVEKADHEDWQRIVLPRLGCGRGGLLWADVRAVLKPILTGDRFVVVSREQGQEG